MLNFSSGITDVGAEPWLGCWAGAEQGRASDSREGAFPLASQRGPWLHLSSFLSFLLPVLLFVLPSLLNLGGLGAGLAGAVGVHQLPSPSMADTKGNRAHHHGPGWAEGGVCGGTHRGDPGLGRQAGPWAGK